MHNANPARGYHLDISSHGFGITHEDGAGNGESFGFGVYNDAAEALAVLETLAAKGRPTFISRRAKAAARRQGAL